MEHSKKKSSEFIDIVGLFLYYLKYWKWFLLSFIICGGLALFYLRITPKTFSHVSNILIKTEDSRTSALSSNAVKSLGFGGLSASESIDDEIGILSSHTLMKQMAYDLHLYKSYSLVKFPVDKSLYNNSPITIDVSRAFLDTITSGLSFEIKKKNAQTIIEGKYGKQELGKFDINKFPATIETNIGPFTFKENKQAKALESYKLKINISGLDNIAELYMNKIYVHPASKKSNIITLEVTDIIKSRGQDILNQVVKLYNADALSDKNKMALNTANFIKERIDTISTELNSIEKGIENYKRINDIIDIGVEASSSLGKVASLREKAIESEIQLSLLEMIENHLNDPNNKYTLVPFSSSMPGDISGGINSYNAAIMERTFLLKSASESNPIILSINQRLDLLKENVILSIQNVRKEINFVKKDWSETEKVFQARLNEVPRQEREFLDIKRQQQIKAELYIFLLQKLQEAELTLASNTPKAKVIDVAYTVVKPVAPKGLMTLFLGLVIGGIIPIAVIIIKDLFKSNLSDVSELQKYTDLSILGEICKDKSGEKIVVSETSNTPTAELFRLIRTNLQFVLTKKEDKVILVTSSISGEGKSFFTVNLATSLSLIKGKKIIIVGLDIRNPKLTEYLSLKNNKGMTSYLASEEYKPEDIIMNLNSVNPNLYFVPAGPIPPNPSELLLNDRLEAFFEYLRLNFDYIIVDTAPVGMVSDTYSLARISDATIYLYRADFTNKSYLKLVNNIVEEDKLKKVYLVMNGTKTKSGYGYGYGAK